MWNPKSIPMRNYVSTISHFPFDLAGRPDQCTAVSNCSPLSFSPSAHKIWAMHRSNRESYQRFFSTCTHRVLAAKKCWIMVGPTGNRILSAAQDAVKGLNYTKSSQLWRKKGFPPAKKKTKKGTNHAGMLNEIVNHLGSIKASRSGQYWPLPPPYRSRYLHAAADLFPQLVRVCSRYILTTSSTVLAAI